MELLKPLAKLRKALLVLYRESTEDDDDEDEVEMNKDEE